MTTATLTSFPASRAASRSCGLPGARGAVPMSAIYRRRRLVVGAIFVMAFVLLGAVLNAGVASLLSSNAVADAPTPAATVHVVQPGESLWTIAEELTAPGADVRVTLDQLAELNGSHALNAGARILVPGELVP
jgi:hypothetical protein